MWRQLKSAAEQTAEELAKAPLKVPATLPVVLSPGRDTSLQITPTDSNARQPACFHSASIGTRRASDRARLQL